MDNIIQLSLWQMAAAFLYIAVLLVIVRLRGIPREKDILFSALRMTVQLSITGFILVQVFKNPSPLLTLIIITVMEAFAVNNAVQRCHVQKAPKIIRLIALSLVSGTLASILYFLFVVVQVDPWYDPQYFIPLSGMLIGNSMTGITLGINALINGTMDKKDQIEGALMLGATPKQATRELMDQAFEQAILPTVNSMLGIGIVFLPGMMTGQILSGTSPLTAIRYQIAIMLGILGSVALSVTLFVHFALGAFFNKRQQLELPEISKK